MTHPRHPATIGTTSHVIFHNEVSSIAKSLYLTIFSDSLLETLFHQCLTQLLVKAKSTGQKVLSLNIIIIIIIIIGWAITLAVPVY